MSAVQDTFNAAWKASLLPSIAEALPLTASQAASLAAAGNLIDVPLMVYGWDPWSINSQRVAAGLDWVPSALQQPLNSPTGYAMPGFAAGPNQTPYPTIPPPNTIRVSTNPADYPPFVTPVPKPPAPTDAVGGLNFGNIYFTVPGFTYVNGQTYTDTRGTFTAVVVATPFGNEDYLELTTPA